jgi:phosphatidylinositol alpha-1,6-mannosyltransferase
MTSPRDDARGILLVSEWFPPAVGGSGELLANIYSKVSSQRVNVITDVRHAAEESGDRSSSLKVVRTAFGSRPGLFGTESLPSQFRLARQIRKTAQIGSIVHCGRALPEGSAAWLSRLAGGHPYLCWTFGEELAYAASSRELSWLLKRVHRGAGALLAICQNTAGLLRDLGNPSAKIHVVYPGVDADRFRPAAGGEAIRRALLQDGELMLLAVGRLQLRKGHDLVIRTLGGLVRSGPRLRYVIVGDGEERQMLESLAVEQGVADRVRFMGKVPSAALPSYYAAADIFVHPNRVDGVDFEGFGLVFLEAAASGLPAIGGRSGGVPEAIEDGRTGMLVGGKDVEELARAIRLLAGSDILRAELGRAARTRALSQFTWERAAGQVDVIDASLRPSTAPRNS